MPLVSLYTSWKHQENLGSDIFREYRKRLATWNNCSRHKNKHGELLYLFNTKFLNITFHPADNYMFKVSNRKTRTRYEICSKLIAMFNKDTRMTPILHLVLVFLFLVFLLLMYLLFLSLTWSWKMPGWQ